MLKPKQLYNFQTRTRTQPVDRGHLYGDFATEMDRDSKLHCDISDRAAYMYITGNYPCHLRSKATAILKQISREYRRPTSVDSRHGHRLTSDEAVRDLRLNSHDMVRKVREKISQGYFIEPSRGFGTRCGFSKIFMFKKHSDKMVYDRITVTLEGALKQGWD